MKYVKYDKEKLEITLDFYKWDFFNGNIRIEIDDNGDMHFYRAGRVKIVTIQNLASKDTRIEEIERSGLSFHEAISKSDHDRQSQDGCGELSNTV